MGIDHDTAEFAVESIRRWWQQMGQAQYPRSKHLLITADCGGSNGYRNRLWKLQLQEFADATGLTLHICHFPPGTSKWNKIEHRLFCHITTNWRGQPLTDLQTVINLISGTITQTGLKVHAQLDDNLYPTGIQVSEEPFNAIAIQRCRLLDLNQSVRSLAAQFLSRSNLPPKASDDAVHITAATVHGLDYLLTWNCKHIANAQTPKKT